MTNRFSEFNTSKRLLGLITRERMLDSLSAMAGWLGEAQTAARGKGVGYRDIIYYADGTHQWLYPHSNAGEQINVFLWLHDALGDGRCLQQAIEYADITIADPVHGIYRGEHAEAHGLPWYWRDIGVYGVIYGMRFPAGFHALFQKTGKAIYEEYTHLTAAPLLSRQPKLGLIDAGWSPQNRWAEAGNRINSRVGYAMGVYAFMDKITGEPRWLDGLDRMIRCFEKLQNPDGSFCQTYHTETGEVLDPSIKNHFLGYILNGLTDAYALVADDRLLKMAQRLADFVAANFYYRQAVPYCAGQSPNVADQQELDSPVIDPATGLFKLYKITSDPDYLDIALKLWWHYYIWQSGKPSRPELHGAILQGRNPNANKWLGSITPISSSEPVGHVCIYYQNQYVLSSQQLMGLLEE